MRLPIGHVQPRADGSLRLEKRRMQVIGFAPWKPLPPLIDDPEWDAETFSEQQERLARTVLPDDGGAAEPGDGAAGADGVA